MNDIIQKNNDFLNIYTKSYRLASATFMISNMIDQTEVLRTKIKELSLVLVSEVVNLKDINFLNTRKLIISIEKISLELMSMLDIACVSNLISKMNASILKEEFQNFILELGKFTESFENNKNVSVKDLFAESSLVKTGVNLEKANIVPNNVVSDIYKNKQRISTGNVIKNGNGYKRKDMRKITISDFVKGHNDVSIKDIAANITGCSEKTIQRELISLINEGKIIKTGERRWSRYSFV
jgi:hypothetical protein